MTLTAFCHRITFHSQFSCCYGGLTGADRSSFDAAEHQILHCAMLMDEVWVPTAWMAHTLERISRHMNMPMPDIFVIPEAVDTTLFSPQLDHEHESDSHCSGERGGDGEGRERTLGESCGLDCLCEEGITSPAAEPGIVQRVQFLSIFKW
jgi:hypothetical protein